MLTQVQYDNLMFDVSLLEKDAANYNLPLPLDPVKAAIEAVKPFTPKIVRIPLNIARLVMLQPQHSSDRYERFQRHFVFTTSTINIRFDAWDLSAGGVRLPLAYSKYGLLVNGVERATSVGNFFQGQLVDETDGPAFLEIVAYDANGVRIANPVESLVPFWVWIDRTGNAKNHPDVVAQNGTFDWMWPSPASYNVARRVEPAVYAYVKYPKVLIKLKEAPFKARTPIPFSIQPAQTAWFRENYAPAIDNDAMNTHYPCVTKRGITVVENRQGYTWEDLIQQYSRRPLIDGPRGVATSAYQLYLQVGRNDKIYGTDPWSWWVIDANGTKRTLIGLRHKYAVYWEDAQSMDHQEVVGDWSAVPDANKHYPKKCWGVAWDPRTLDVNNNVPVVNDPPFTPPGGEAPHLVGPTAFLTCGFGRVLKVVFSPTSHTTPAKVTEFITGLVDPWGIVYKDGVLYVAERGKNRIAKFSADDGRYLGDFVADTNGSLYGSVNVADQTFRHNDSYTNVVNGTAAANLRAKVKIYAPEGMAEQDGWLYVGMLALGCVRRYNLTTGVYEDVAFPTMSWLNKSHFITLAVGDGTVGPRGSVWTCTFSELNFGRPEVFVAGKKWDWMYHAYDISMGYTGLRGTTASVYPTSVVAEKGRLVCGNAAPGLETYRLAYDDEKIVVDTVKLQRGALKYRQEQSHLYYGVYLDGHTEGEYPKGVDADIDYWRSVNGR